MSDEPWDKVNERLARMADPKPPPVVQMSVRERELIVARAAVTAPPRRLTDAGDDGPE